MWNLFLCCDPCVVSKIMYETNVKLRKAQVTRAGVSFGRSVCACASTVCACHVLCVRTPRERMLVCATGDRHMASRSLDRRRRRGGMQDVCFIACKVRFHSSTRPRERYLRHANRRKAAASVHALADSIDKLQLPPSPRKRLVFPRHDVGQTFDVFFNIV